MEVILYSRRSAALCMSVLLMDKLVAMLCLDLFQLTLGFHDPRGRSRKNSINDQKKNCICIILIFFIIFSFKDLICIEKVKFLGITLDSKLAFSPMLKYDIPSNIMHQEAFNKLKQLTASNGLFDLRKDISRSNHVAMIKNTNKKTDDQKNLYYFESKQAFDSIVISYSEVY
ncbi:hypothetical protein BpHYR1_012647 [Brachionus plicatilis]|uniref:Uncharacterized protein n=1 Tax=Brachionus plicatilis TaxID=10195 RepID=A0A3M7SV53_BRAPC|nr:hypothetical protein BpHYR1_012647 [Brachionus plicatilis]